MYKQAETRARHVPTQLQLLANALPELIAFVDDKNVIRFCNMALSDWLDASADELAGRNITEVMDEQASATLAPCAKAALQGTEMNCDVTLTHCDRGQRSFHANHIPHSVDGKVLGYCLLMHDATARGRSWLDRKEEQARMVYIQRMATIGEMASTLAHDLNQPLSAINSYAGGLTRMLHAGKSAEETTPILGKIGDQVERASAIVNDVRDFVGRADSGHETLDLNHLLRGAIALTTGRARKLNVDTRVSEHTSLPASQGDSVQIQQVLINLITNAIDAMRDTDSDKRTLWLTTERPDEAHVQVVVTDSGPGIAPGKLESIFDSFQSTKLDGMGMGLAISRSIAQWHGGRLWAESQSGRGATFYLSLPVANAKHEASDSA